MIVLYEINNGIIKFLNGLEINGNVEHPLVYKYIGYSLEQAKKRFRIDNNLRYKHIEFINMYM